MVAAGSVFLTHRSNVDKAQVNVWVPPQHRRRGLGFTILRALEVNSEGRPSLIAQAFVPAAQQLGHPYMSFATNHGFRCTNTEARRRLDLGGPLPDPPDVRPYVVETHLDRLPERHVDGAVALWNLVMVDAPTGETEFEADSYDRAGYDRHVTTLRAAGEHLVSTVALSPAGEVVAFSDLVVGRDATVARQSGTYVHREHRGHRLGMAVTLANVARLRSEHPPVEAVETTNAETNQHMVTINEALGFRPLDLELLLEKPR